MQGRWPCFAVLLQRASCAEHAKTLVWAMQAEARQHKYPHVADFLEYVKFRWMVSFRKLEDPKARHLRMSPPLSCNSLVRVADRLRWAQGPPELGAA